MARAPRKVTGIKAGTEIIPDFDYVPDPKEAPAWFQKAAQELRPLGSAKWSAMRVYRCLLKLDGKEAPWRETDDTGRRYIFGEREEIVFNRYMALLIPALIPDPWMQVKIWCYYDTVREGWKVTNFFGCQNATKSAYSAAMGVAMGVLNPEHTNQRMAEPFKSTGEKKVWRMVQRFAESAKIAHRAELADMRCHIKNSSASDTIRFGMYPDTGFFDLIAADDPGKLQGEKAADPEQQKGHLIAYLGEIALHPTQAFLKVLPNLTSNFNFHAITDCNPELIPGNLDTELGKPKSGFRKLNLDSDYAWDSAYGSRTYRFDGLKSPNMELTRTRWPYIFDRKRLQYFEEAYGKGNPKYNAQVRGLSLTGLGGFFVTSLGQIEAGRVFKEFEWTDAPKENIGFLDAGFGGDPAIFTHLAVGEARDTLHPEGFQVVNGNEQIEIRVSAEGPADEEWLEKIKLARGDSGGVSEGQILSLERKLAIDTALECRKRNILYRNFGYDDSMRGQQWVNEVLWAMGTSPLTISYIGTPQKKAIWPVTFIEEGEGSDRRRRPKRWDEHSQKFVSQVWFQGAAIVHSGMFRAKREVFGMAFDQAEVRRYEQKGKKYDIIPKDEYKALFNQSPDYADSLFGALHVVVERGILRLTFDKANAGKPSSQSSTSNNRSKNRRKRQTGLYSTGTKT